MQVSEVGLGAGQNLAIGLEQDPHDPMSRRMLRTHVDQTILGRDI
jgi:hypothetical protein